MPKLNVDQLVEKCEKFALDHYNDSFEMSAFTECFGREEWLEWFERFEISMFADAKKQMVGEARIRQSVRDEYENSANW